MEDLKITKANDWELNKYLAIMMLLMLLSIGTFSLILDMRIDNIAEAIKTTIIGECSPSNKVPLIGN